METLHEFRNLVKSPAWARLVDAAEKQIEFRERQIIQMDMNTDEDVNEVRTLKAERSGIKLFLQIPTSIIENLEEDLKDEHSEG